MKRSAAAAFVVFSSTDELATDRQSPNTFLKKEKKNTLILNECATYRSAATSNKVMMIENIVSD
jgi:hypothetical protein